MAYRDSTSNTGTSATPSTAVPTGVQANDIIILVASTDTSGNTFVGKFPAGFTLLEEVTAGPDGGKQAFGWKRATGADSGSYTFASIGASDVFVCQAWAFSGRHAVNPPTFTSTNNTGSNPSAVTATVPTITTLVGDDLLTLVIPDVTITGAFNAYTSRPSGYTADEAAENTWQNIAGDHLEDTPAAATGTKTYVYTLTSGNSGWYAVHVRIPCVAKRPTVFNNYQFVAVGDGMSTGERIR